VLVREQNNKTINLISFSGICAKNSINETSATDSIKQGDAFDNTQKSRIKRGFNEE
jgi:hypothetical protein|tara:strand:- start:83 stop:250 length:168 start_codon:yes stop_codon:yes gene_type:complete